MPRKKQDRPKHVTKWDEGSGGGEGKECEDDNANDNDCRAQHASDTDDTNAESDTKCADEAREPLVSNNAGDAKEAQTGKCDIAVTRLNSSDSALALRLNSKKGDDSYHRSSSRLSESDITSTQQSSPPAPPTRPMDAEHVSAPLDFSIRAGKRTAKSESAKQNGPISTKDMNHSERTAVSDAPLDLSLGKRLFTLSSSPASSAPSASSTHASSQSQKSPISAKVARFDASSPWSYSAPRVLTPPKQSVSQSHPEMTTLWNGKLKNNALTSKHSPTGTPASAISPGRVSSAAAHSGRQNPWQTQWINRSSEQTRDVFTCVWCKESFRSLAEMTDHMKKSPRCGMAGMQHASTAATHNSQSMPTGATPTPSHQPSTSTPKEPISSSVLAKNNVGLPRKLVRGQDVWLGRGAEQTRQILKCMWCGQSFKTLADMTTHMRVTQHYTNIISQEQIISWRTPEDKLTQAQVNAVLTCKVCDEAFGSLKELSYHMVKNAHYKEHILRSITEGGHGRRRQTRERRKKSLPVRKLLELERREMSKSDKDDADSPAPLGANGQSITCDECHEKVDAKNFISHIKICKTQLKSSARAFQFDKGSPEPAKSPSSSGSRSGPPSRGQTISPQMEVKTEMIENESRSDPTKDDASDMTATAANASESPVSSFGSVLNAIERLIEKSFDSKSRKAQSTGILQRLGIDEEVCPPWQHMPQVSSWCRNGGGEFFNDGRTSSRSSGHHSSSPLTQDLNKENNGSIDSADSSDCDDTSSDGSLLHNIGVPLKSSAESKATSLKLSFPISALISEKRGHRIDQNSSPKTEENHSHAEKNSPTLQSADRDRSGETKADKLSDISDDEKPLKSPKREALSPPVIDKRSSDQRQSSDEKPNRRSTQSTQSQRTRAKHDVSDKNGSTDSDAFHPLMQLQKLLDKTDSGTKNKLTNAGNQVSNNSGAGVSASSLLAFSWACNDATASSTNAAASLAAMAAAGDEKPSKSEQHMMKCAFCETHFISKGAYRHHLSKMHFIKADKHGDLPNAGDAGGGKEGATSGSSSAGGQASDAGIAAESPHSKFLKYTELAKQLSSKYV